MLRHALIGGLKCGLASGGLFVGLTLVREGHLIAGSLGLLVGTAASASLIRYVVRDFRRRREYWKAWQVREGQSDAVFLHGCGLTSESPDAPLALHVRGALADAAGVPRETIHAADSMRDSIWDSMDLLDVCFRVEKSALVKIPSPWFNDVRTLAEDPSKVQVRHLVLGIIRNAIPMSSRSSIRRLEHPA